jgi:hypothetical protein
MSYYIKQLKYHPEILSEINQNNFGALPETLDLFQIIAIKQWSLMRDTFITFPLKDAFHPQPINWRQIFGSYKALL